MQQSLKCVRNCGVAILFGLAVAGVEPYPHAYEIPLLGFSAVFFLAVQRILHTPYAKRFWLWYGLATFLCYAVPFCWFWFGAMQHGWWYPPQLPIVEQFFLVDGEAAFDASVANVFLVLWAVTTLVFLIRASTPNRRPMNAGERPSSVPMLKTTRTAAFLLLAFSSGVTLLGLLWYAGAAMPYPDAPAEVIAAQAQETQRVGWLVLTGLVGVVLGAVGILLSRRRIRQSHAGDVPSIAALVNQAYRPDAAAAGWTHESALVAGARVSASQVAEMIAGKGVVLLACEGPHIVGCVHVEEADNGACAIGMLATLPSQQNRGLGKRLLAAAEAWAVTHYAATAFKMSVLSARPELLAYYERRGYYRTGVVTAYPLDADVGTPLTADLQVLELRKQV